MSIKLHRCRFTFLRSDRFECHRVQQALDDQGIDYELVKAPYFPRSRRKEVERLSGQRLLPVIEFEDGSAYREESADMAATIRSGQLDTKQAAASLDKDFDSLTITLVADFDAPAERVWLLWADPRQLERWWGPPTHPATVEEHDLTPGGGVTYFMTGPEGEKYRGWWRVTSVDPPKSLEFTDGFANEDGTPNAGMPTTTVQLHLTEHDGGTRMELRSAFDSREQMEQLVNMGAAEGLQQAVGQMDALLAD